MLLCRAQPITFTVQLDLYRLSVTTLINVVSKLSQKRDLGDGSVKRCLFKNLSDKRGTCLACDHLE